MKLHLINLGIIKDLMIIGKKCHTVYTGKVAAVLFLSRMKINTQFIFDLIPWPLITLGDEKT